MRVVIAPDSFKDAMRATQVAKHIAQGLRSGLPDVVIDLCPVADGGEGFADAITQRQNADAQTHHIQTVDPLGRPIRASWVLLNDPPARRLAVIELASASGLERVQPTERDVMRTSTFGTGSVIRHALEHQPTEMLMGIGGSATNDAGCGIAQALGVRFFDADGQVMPHTMTGSDLMRTARIDVGELVVQCKTCPIRVAYDVSSPLTGPQGAAFVYAPQKGASPEQVEQLDAGLQHIAKLWREQLGIDVQQLRGSGAAGGVGGGLVAMLGAKLVPGAELVLDTIGFDQRIKDADLVITGEGRLDSQSLQGKAAMAVAKGCQQAGVPCIALVGSVGEGAELTLQRGLTRYVVIGEGLSQAESIRRVGQRLEQTAGQLAHAYSSG